VAVVIPPVEVTAALLRWAVLLPVASVVLLPARRLAVATASRLVEWRLLPVASAALPAFRLLVEWAQLVTSTRRSR